MSGAILIQLCPELILLIGACVALVAGVARVSKDPQLVPGIALAATLFALLLTLVVPVAEGGAGFPGLRLCPLTFYARLIGLAVGALIVLVNWHQPAARERGEYMAMILFSLLGALLTASADDLIVLFFAVELVSLPAYVLIALSRKDPRALEAAVKYFFLGALASAIFAYGVSFLYGAAGTTAMYSITNGVARSHLALGPQASPLGLIGLLLVFAGLAFKVAAVPLHAYVADVYEGAAAPVAGMLGFVPKFAGFVALMKIFCALQWQFPAALFWLIWAIAAVTMTVGNVLALLQTGVKRMLAYSSIAHTGYMLIALLVGPVAGEGPMRDGLAALLFYIAIYGVMNLGAFAVISAFSSGEREETETLDDAAGLAARAPWTALALAVCVFSLMGFPPTAGFLGKLYVFSSAFSLGDARPFGGPLIVLAVIGVVNSAIGAAYYLRIVYAAYVCEPAQAAKPAGGAPLRWGVALCSIPLLLLFAWPGALITQARLATGSLQEPITAKRADWTLPPGSDGRGGGWEAACSAAPWHPPHDSRE